MSPKIIGLIAHTGKPGAAELVQAVMEEFARVSLPVKLEAETARHSRAEIDAFRRATWAVILTCLWSSVATGRF